MIWAYVGRATTWEGELNEEMQSLVVPEDDPSNQASLVEEGPFISFPHYGTAVANINIEKANLLADFTGWMVYKNQNLFREALGLPLIEEDTQVSSESTDDEIDFGVGLIALTCGMALLVVVLLVVAWYYYSHRSSKTNETNSFDDDQDKRQSEMTRTSSLNSSLMKKDAVLSSNMA